MIPEFGAQVKFGAEIFKHDGHEEAQRIFDCGFLIVDCGTAAP